MCITFVHKCLFKCIYTILYSCLFVCLIMLFLSTSCPLYNILLETKQQYSVTVNLYFKLIVIFLLNYGALCENQQTNERTVPPSLPPPSTFFAQVKLDNGQWVKWYPAPPPPTPLLSYRALAQLGHIHTYIYIHYTVYVCEGTECLY